MIIGQPGSGKSTLARALAGPLNLPVYHMDIIHWQTGWIARSGTDKDRLCAEVHSKENWIFEGGRSSMWSERLARADTLIWLDFPLTIRAYRVCRRTILHFGKSRPDLPEGCPERFSLEFTKWIWNTRNTGRDRMQKLFDSASVDVEKYRLMSQRHVDDLIGRLAES